MTGTTISSAALTAGLPEDGDAVIALDGTSLSQEQLAEVRAALADEVGDDLSHLP